MKKLVANLKLRVEDLEVDRPIAHLKFWISNGNLRLVSWTRVLRGTGWKPILRLVVAFFLLTSVFLSKSVASEPYEKFLSRLREERLFDLALLYLDDIQKRPGLDPEFARAIDLEKALLYYDSAGFSPLNTPQRAEKLSQAEQALKRFVQSEPDHPRRGEARIKLGGLLQLRAQESLLEAGVSLETDAETLAQEHANVVDAIRYFDDAHKLFESTIEELAQVEGTLKGDRVDARDAKQVAYREQVRQDLREAQLLSAKAVADRGLSRATGSDEQKADLETAVKMLSELYSKEQLLLGIRFYALFYRSQLHARLGKPDDAIDGLLRIVDQEGVDALRLLQTDAVTELTRILTAEGKYEAAIDRAEKWIAGLRNNEQSTIEATDLQLEYAKTRIAWIEKLKSTDSKNNSISRVERKTRDDLRTLARQGGAASEQANLLLAKLGVEKQEARLSTELPKLKDLTQALEEAHTRVDNANAIGVNVEVFNERLASGEIIETEKPALETQREELKAEANQNLEQALALIREGLRLYNIQSDDRSKLFNARYQLAYLLLKLGQVREAIVVGEFLSRTSPATPQGLNAARVALSGYSELMRDAEADSVALVKEFAPLAEYIIATWPQSNEATSVSGALMQLAVHTKDWDRAEQYLERLPESDQGVAKQYSQLGGALYDQFQRSLDDETVSLQQRDALRVRAERWLRLAADKASSDDFPIKLNVSSALASIQLAQGDVHQAATLFLTGENSPLQQLESDGDSISQDAALEAYRTALRILAAQVAAGELDSQSASTAMQRYVDQLQKVAATTDEGRKKMPSIFASIARDMKDKLALIDQPEKRAQFANVVTLVMNEAAKSESFSTQYWAANSLVSIASELANQGTDAARPVYESATRLLKQMTETAKQNPAWVDPPTAELPMKLLLATSSEGAGDLRTSLQTYGEILDQNENLLDVQIRVAEALQRSAADNPSRFEAAIQGARPNPKTGANAFWGWGKIGQITSRKMESFGPQFFEARYQLAHCRLQLARSQKNHAAKTAELGRAERTLTETRALYPDLGGPDDVKRHDALMKSIRKELGKEE